jgi:DNA-binding response OmpR family regulator
MVRTPQESSAPRVLLVMPDQWPRALLRSALREAGYDAIGTRTLTSALRVRASDPRPVSLIVLDQAAVVSGDDAALARLLARHGNPPTILIARATASTPEGPWRRVLRRPLSVADIVAAVESLLPLPRDSRRPIDENAS